MLSPVGMGIWTPGRFLKGRNLLHLFGELEAGIETGSPDVVQTGLELTV